MIRTGYLCLLILAAYCPSGFTYQHLDANDELVARGGLPNFFKKIQNGDSLKVAYLGGSITAQPGWRVQSLEWFRQRFPNASFSEIHAAIGGTGSAFGAFRVNDHVLKYRPDLVFVEFAVNDHRASEEKITRSMESIVRQIWSQDPATDICFVYTTIEGFLTPDQRGELPASAQTMEKIAERYGIPSINFGIEVYRLVANRQLLIKGSELEIDGKPVFSRDGVHPHPETGHKIYTTVLKRSFEQLASQKKKAKNGKRMKPEPLATNPYSQPRLVGIDEISPGGNWEILDTKEDAFFSRFGNFLDKVGKATPGETLSFRFKGTAIGAYDFMGPGTGRILLTLDGHVRDTIYRFDSYCTYTRMNYFIIDNLADKEHRVDIKVLDGSFDKAAILAKRNAVIDDPEKYRENNWYVGKLLLDGNLNLKP